MAKWVKKMHSLGVTTGIAVLVEFFRTYQTVFFKVPGIFDPEPGIWYGIW